MTSRQFLARLALALPALLLSSALLAPSARAADKPYDESSDAKAQIQAGLQAAGAAHVPLLIVFGANWCADCHALDAAMKQGRTATLMAQQFRVVKVDVGNFDRNLDVVNAYGNPIKKGIPAAVIVSPSNQVLYATKGGELADARHMSETGIYDFFHQAAQANAGAVATGH
jgi:protein disulfide-isomerase